MSQGLDSFVQPFVDRRSYPITVGTPESVETDERRQFTNSHEDLSSDAQELATAIDAYKLRHRRRFISYEEMLNVMKMIGYHK